MRYRLEIVSPWTGTGKKFDAVVDGVPVLVDDSYRPQLGEDYRYATLTELSVRTSTEYISNPNIGTLVFDAVDWYRVTTPLFPDPILVGGHDPFLSHPSITNSVLEITADEVVDAIEADSNYLILTCEKVAEVTLG